MSKNLNEYNSKRDFKKTLEPKGKIEKSNDGLIFVVQHHIASADHYDFRLEWEGVLLSWAVPKGPSYNTREKRLAIKVEDHPISYHNFEGIIPKDQYGGGVVMLWDTGIWKPNVDIKEGLSKGELKFSLEGSRLKGNWALIKWKNKSDNQKNHWLLLKEKDEYVNDDYNISKFDTSITTGRTMSEIKSGQDASFKTNSLEKVDAHLAKLVKDIPKEEGWIYETKYDGYRIIAFAESNIIKLQTRNHKDYTDKFPSITKALLDLASGRSMVLDGEMAITEDSGKTDFQSLQKYMSNSKSKKPTYIIFDILSLDGDDLREKPLVERKNILERIMKGASPNLHYSGYVIGQGKESFKAACEAGLEGIIGKKADSFYRGGRDGSWIKIKCDNRQEFVIGGYTLTDKRKSGISALLLGVYQGEELNYIGRAGTGISEADIKLLEGKFASLKRNNPYFINPPKERSTEKITWLKPELIAEIKFADWTKNNLLRQASYKGIREDKNTKSVEAEKPQTNKPEVEGIIITHPKKHYIVPLKSQS